ncbi:NAD(P)H-dependent oxidoreductase [Propionivibrio limicola]|uniref:NAD(P)H-dependent oxidoreductase n=1 Tax=Propionivibrio limicola TaxID=167645 RepID=UPI001B872F84|nr:NAD(P)H-dependent oxidoreductase [Propionivibrio limicola]
MTALNVAVLCGSLQRPSRTLVLCEALLAKIGEHRTIVPHVVEIAQIGRTLGACLKYDELPPEIVTHLSAVVSADILIAASPVYSATYTGMFKHFIDFVGMDALAGKPTLLAATGGSPLHGLMIDQLMRPLFAMKQALTLPIGVYATESDFTDYRITSPGLEKRIALAVDLALPFLPLSD